MSRRFNLVLTGVGGQGLITLGRLIGEACIRAGLNVTVAEVHGMSQRGGSVIVHVRIGEGDSPVIPVGGAHHIIAMEVLEAGRSVRYANKDTVMVVNDLILPPPLAKYPGKKDVIEALKSKLGRVYLYDAEGVSKRIMGTPISSNIALLGFSLGVNPALEDLIGKTDVEKAIEAIFKGKALELNMKVFEEAFKEGKASVGG
ncbi:indolepyruvate oxidoreductase subunit beta [Thermosphaera chiliense]|uniref:Indolepyruvate oxidoreductase subunit beta n=1 Tax=Thermosphaera chiliense TaxID=3402707 RepID=A0A7M1US09_9CREN|nr:indolepyruvate oxidoreductase subunit beta [Thermosphaera aggregans]QOR94243.1 indolepyruvate oxidoreductase subunit beta [Thermosphaera aggregans]